MPGKHKIEVKTAAGAWAQEVTIEAGKMLDVRATVGAVAAAKTPATPVKTPVKAPDKTPAVPDKLTVAVKTPDKTATPSVAPKAKESDPPRDRPKTADKAPEPKKAKGPDLTIPDEDKPAPKKVAAADRPAPEAKSPSDKPAPSEKAAAAASGDGWLRLGSKPWTNILVDGKETGLHTPQTHLKLGAGSHRITLTNPQFSIKETFSVDIKAGETETVIKDLRPQGGDSD